jgi:hypothetical protein
MVNYFLTHYFSELRLSINGVQHIPASRLFSIDSFPMVSYAGGVVFFLSTEACHALMEEMESVDFDVFHFSEDSG